MGIRIADNGDDTGRVSCYSCGELIYPQCAVLANHHIQGLSDGRTRITSLDFGIVVHVCEHAPAERADRLAAEAQRYLVVVE